MTGVSAVGAAGTVGASAGVSAAAGTSGAGSLPSPIASFANAATALAVLALLSDRDDDDNRKKGAGLLAAAMLAVAFGNAFHLINAADRDAYEGAGARVLASSSSGQPQMTNDRVVSPPPATDSLTVTPPHSVVTGAYAANSSAVLGSGMSIGGGMAVGAGGAVAPATGGAAGGAA